MLRCFAVGPGFPSHCARRAPHSKPGYGTSAAPALRCQRIFPAFHGDVSRRLAVGSIAIDLFHVVQISSRGPTRPVRSDVLREDFSIRVSLALSLSCFVKVIVFSKPPLLSSAL